MTVSKIPSVLTVNSRPNRTPRMNQCCGWVFWGKQTKQKWPKKIVVAESWWSVYSNWWMYNIDSIPTTVCFLMIAFPHCIGQQRRFCSSILRVQKLKMAIAKLGSILKFGSWLFLDKFHRDPNVKPGRVTPLDGPKCLKNSGLAIIEICPDWFLCFSKPIHHRIKHQTAWRYASYLEDGLPVSFSG